MGAVLVLAALGTLAYALVNAFGSWMVVRRKPLIAALFMLSASVLVVAFAALAFGLAQSRAPLALGLLLASVTSWLNARVVLGRVVWRHHLLRALLGMLLYLLAEVALG